MAEWTSLCQKLRHEQVLSYLELLRNQAVVAELALKVLT